MSRISQKLVGSIFPSVAILVFLVTATFAQDSEVTSGIDLNTWKSKSGKTSNAMLLSIDEKSRKVTLLIPKEISFEDLDEESIQLTRSIAKKRQQVLSDNELAKQKTAQKLLDLKNSERDSTTPNQVTKPVDGKTDTKLVEQNKVKPEKQSIFSKLFGAKKQADGPEALKAGSGLKNVKWYQGGTLHNKTALEWQVATAADKLATCSDFFANMWDNENLKSSISKELLSVEDVRPYAQELVEFLDAAFKPDPNPDQNRKLFTNQSVAGTTAIGMVTMGWAK